MAKKPKKVKIEEIKDETSEEDVLESNSSNEQPKEEKKRKFFDEIKSFFILAVIIGVVVLAGWLFYKYAKPIENKENDGNTIVENEGYKTVVYKSQTGDLEVVGDKYLIEYDGDKLKKIMNLYSETLYEAINDEYYKFVVGIDGNLYAIETLDYDIEDEIPIFNLYVLENNKLVQVKEFIDENTNYNFIYQIALTENVSYPKLVSDSNEKDNALIAIYSNKEYMDENLNDIVERKIYTLDGKEFDIGSLSFEGDIKRLGIDVQYYTVSDRYITFSIYKEDEEKSYVGLYDLKEGEVVIDPTYEGLYTTSDGNYVAIKNGKVGIINKKLKKIVDFKYDFIDINKDFYVVGKDKKLAIMNKDFEFVTGFDFDYQDADLDIEYDYQLCCTSFNTFRAYKMNDKYILTTNNYELSYGGLDYKKSETYVISNDGKYKTIKANEFGLFDSYAYGYLKESKKIVIYDTDKFEEVSTIDLSSYDFDDYHRVNILENDIVEVKLDSELYFNAKTSEEIESINNINLVILDTKIDFDSNNKKIKFTLDNKLLLEENIEKDSLLLETYSFYNMIDDNKFYYNSGSSYVLVEKR